MARCVNNGDIIHGAFDVLKSVCDREERGLKRGTDMVYMNYIEVAEILLAVSESEKKRKKALGSKILAVVNFCVSRAEALKRKSFSVGGKQISCQLFDLLSKYSVENAVVLDEKKEVDNSLKWYTNSIGYMMKVSKLGGTVNQKFLLQLFSRAETLKKQEHRKSLGKTRVLSEEELAVLRRTSTMGGIRILPFSYQDLKEKFRFTNLQGEDVTFSDPDGFLKLSSSQKKHFKNWMRPSQFMRRGEPVMIREISPYTIKQSVVTDCSFVSSLIVTAAYERRFRKRLITGCIYPQKKGCAVYNPCGKYMVRLFFNGCARRVIVDDRFPVDESGELLCCHSSHPNELWVSVMEKAFLKVNGGYDFPGSTSTSDLYNLTGWIPETCKTDDSKFDADATWKRISNGHKLGQCLITCSTGKTKDYESVGLAEGHAYACLDVREVQGVRLMLIKNPWGRRRWKGKFSPNDTKSWTPSLRRILKYDLIGALQYDNGIFWIPYEELLKYFSRIRMSWNPKMFENQSNCHARWKLKPFHSTDKYNVSKSPQFRLIIGGTGNTWIMLSRHVKHVNDDDVFLGMYVYEGTGGNRVHRKGFLGKPINDVVYTNEKHRRVCINTEKEEITAYTIVISQFDKVNLDVNFTVDAYSTARVKILPLPYPNICANLVGEWKGITAAGSINDSTSYKNNPQMSLKIRHPGLKDMVLTLDTMGVLNNEKKVVSVNITVFKNAGKVIDRPTENKIVLSSETYTSYFCAVKLENPEFGVTYTVVVSTYSKGAEAPFRFQVEGPNNSVNLFWLKK